jgi:hypothetical protein
LADTQGGILPALAEKDQRTSEDYLREPHSLFLRGRNSPEGASRELITLTEVELYARNAVYNERGTRE